MSLHERVGISSRQFRNTDECTKLKSDIFMISIIAREGEKEWIVLDLGEFFSIILMASGTRSWPVPGSKTTRYSKYLFYGRAELVSLGHQSSVWGPGTVSGRGAILTRDNTGESLESRDRVSKHFNSMCQCGETALKPRWWHQGCRSPVWDRGPNKDRKPGRGSRLSWDTPQLPVWLVSVSYCAEQIQ